MKSTSDFSSRFRILKGGKISLVVSVLLGGATISFAAPNGGIVTSGAANIAQSGTVTNITQTTSKASINWQSFSIASNETVNFNQPNSSSITLNRVIGNETSVIDGALNANGQVWLLNSNGVLFGKNASINTAGLLATTAQLSDADFQNGNYNFTDANSNSVINEGTITISDNGSVILASNEVGNSGTIKAIKGKVHLTGASDYTINLNGNSLVNLKVEKGVLDAMVENSGTILADGGEIYLTTNAVNELLKGVVNNTGIIEANSLDGLTGHVELFAHGGTATVDGTIEAQGGFVETSGKELSVKSTAQIKTTHWLLDPDNIIISSAGEDDLSGAAINATAIQNALLNADVEILAGQQSGEDITVNENITWATNKKLTLTAGEVYVNAIIQNTNTTDGGVYFNATNQVIFNANGKVIVNNASQLQWTSTARAGNYELGNDIDLAGTSWTPYWFTGTFDGLGHTISNLTINKPTEDYIGLFSKNNGTIKNIGLTNVDITGRMHVGSIVADNRGTITNAYSTGQVEGTMGYVGGLVSENFGDIEDSYSFVNVQGSSLNIGGLVGQNGGGNIKRSFATGSVIASNAIYVGGLVGVNQANIKDSFALGDVTGQDAVGGFVGQQTSTGTISTSYSTGKVTGNSGVGGFLGVNFEFNNNGNYGTVSNSYWDSDASGIATGIGTNSDSGPQAVTEVKSSTGTSAYAQNSYIGFDIDTVYDSNKVWYITEGDIRPVLRMIHSTDITNAYQLQLIDLDRTLDYTLKNDIDLTNVKNRQSDIWNTAKGWSPIRNNYSGTFDGAGYTIDNLYINQSDDESGLFYSILSDGVVKNLTLKNVNILNTRENMGAIAYQNEGTLDNVHITGTSVLGSNSLDIENIGGLVGSNFGTIKNSTSNANILVNSASYGAGGLVGTQNGGSIENSSSTGDVTASSSTGKTGGLVGLANGADIKESFAKGDVVGGSNTGGLVGNLSTSNLTLSYTKDASVTGTDYTGGLVGYSYRSHIEKVYATNSVEGRDYVGGLIGKADYSAPQNHDATVVNSYAGGNVKGRDIVGGLIGEVLEDTVTDSFSYGKVTATGTDIGGLIGKINDTTLVTNSFWDSETSEQSTSAAGTSKTTAQLQDIATFSGTTPAWNIESDSTLENIRPFLAWQKDGNSYTSTWVIGKKSVSNNTPTTTQTIQDEIADIITPILNGTRTVVNPPQIRVPQTPNQAPRVEAQTAMATNMGLGNARIVSTTNIGEQPSQVVSLGELQQANGGVAGAGADVRVPLSQNSIVDLVNGGINLPSGVEQQFFVVADNEN